MDNKNIEQAYTIAKDQYAAIGVDTDAAMKKLQTVPVSMHCWQGDDVGGFERVGGSELSGGIQATGNYPGKARTIDELRGDIEKALANAGGEIDVIITTEKDLVKFPRNINTQIPVFALKIDMEKC